MAYSDYGASPAQAVTVVAWDGSCWNPVGPAGFSGAQADYISLAFDPSTYEAYVAYSDWGASTAQAATVMSWDGGAWNLVGTAGFSGAPATFVSIVFQPNSSLPYVAYEDFGPSRVTVQAWDSFHISWKLVGPAGLSDGGAEYVCLAFKPSSSAPYVAYSDYSISGAPATVKAFDGSSWNLVGSAGFSGAQAYYLNLAFSPSNSLPYVSYSEDDNSASPTLAITVMAYDGVSQWADVGPSVFSGFGAYYPSLAFDPTSYQPYVAYTGRSGQPPEVRRYPMNTTAPPPPPSPPP